MENEGNGRREKDYAAEVLNYLVSLSHEIGSFHNEMSMRLGRLEERMGKLESRTGQVEGRLMLVEARLTTMEERSVRQETLVLDARNDGKEAKQRLRELREEVQRVNGGQTQLDERISYLEHRRRAN